MALVVEDGTGLATAEAYASVSFADTYLAAYAAGADAVAPAAWTAGSTAVKENALRQGAQWIDRKWDGSWKGLRYLLAQRLSHPRIGVEIDGFTWDYQTDGLPRALAEANCEAALLFVGGEELFENQETSGALEVDRIKVDVIELEERYSGGRSEADVYGKVEALLRLLVEDSASVIRG